MQTGAKPAMRANCRVISQEHNVQMEGSAHAGEIMERQRCAFTGADDS
jgi:hypothetical protein